MKLKIGDAITIDGEEFLVNSLHHDGYWLVQSVASPYYYLRFVAQEEIDEYLQKGRAALGKLSKIKTSGAPCSWHEWRRYVGARELYDYCVKCDAKKEVNMMRGDR